MKVANYHKLYHRGLTFFEFENDEDVAGENQFCPIIRVSPTAFGIGRRVPIVGKYLS